MASIGRNEPCPCGSGKKHKRCCLATQAAGRGYTQEERAAALIGLSAFTAEALGDEDDVAYRELLGLQYDRWLYADDAWNESDDAFHDLWFWFDRPLWEGSLVAARLLAERPPRRTGVQRFLTTLTASCVRLYEVEDALPGLSVSLREVLDGARVTVRERTASRSMRRGDLLAARIVPAGASGEPEIEMGALGLPNLIRGSLVARLAAMRERFREAHFGATEAAFWKSAAPVLHGAWVSCILDPPVPRLTNTDGEALLITRVRFVAHDARAVAHALDATPELDRDGATSAWRWVVRDHAGKAVSFGVLTLDGGELVLETNSAERASRGRAMIEGRCGPAVSHRATSHEDPTRELQQSLRAGVAEGAEHAAPEGVPAEVLEDLVLAQYGRHYRAWIDEPVPALEGCTPRQASTHPRLRPRVDELLLGLDGMYQSALTRGEPAYDASWMRAELGLIEAPGPAQLPPLHHERMAQRVDGFGACARSVAARLRGPTGEAVGTFTLAQLGADLDVRRFLRDAAPHVALEAHLSCVINFEVWRRKTLWVDEALAFLFARTDLDLLGRDLRLPFDSFALVFNDRGTLSLAERLLARDRTCPLAGCLLRVATVYVTEEVSTSRRVLRLVFALDTLGADAPHLVEHPITLDDDAPIELPAAGGRVAVDGGDEGLPPPVRPLRGLVQVALNAMVYATSAGVDPRAHPRPSGRSSSTPQGSVESAEEVYYLPGTIPISRLRQMQDIERAPGGRGLLHRFLVRGHWRRPSLGWKDQRMRWIEPYWKGPELAAVIERAYKLRP